MYKSIKFLLFFTAFLNSTILFAEVKPATLFADHAVLQRNTPIPVWGTASPGEQVTVTLNAAIENTTADATGKWMVRLKKQKAGGLYKMEIKGTNTVNIEDIYVGEVWLCSGQSNMDMTVAKEDRYWCGVNNEAEEVAKANYPQIRVFDVDFIPSNTIKTDAIGKWEVCSPQTVGHLSAIAYFFAREIYQKLNIPVGMITSAFGASTAETWISKPALDARPNLKPLMKPIHRKRKNL